MESGQNAAHTLTQISMVVCLSEPNLDHHYGGRTGEDAHETRFRAHFMQRISAFVEVRKSTAQRRLPDENR